MTRLRGRSEGRKEWKRAEWVREGTACPIKWPNYLVWKAKSIYETNDGHDNVDGNRNIHGRTEKQG